MAGGRSRWGSPKAGTTVYICICMCESMEGLIAIILIQYNGRNLSLKLFVLRSKLPYALPNGGGKPDGVIG